MRIVYMDAGEHIIDILTEDLTQSLKDIADFEIFTGTPSPEEQLERAKDADAILLGKHLSNDVIRQCKNLKVISFVGYGAKNYIDLDFIHEQGITVTNTPSYGDNAVAEHALTLLLSLTKNIVTNHNQLKDKVWNQSNRCLEVKRRIIGLVGIGSIGERMAELCQALGMEVICWTLNPSQERSERLGIRFVELDELFRLADFVSIHLPYIEQTEKMIGEQQFSQMKDGALFINTARAEIVDNDALVRNLKSKKIAGAGLDVYDVEPIAKDDPFLALDNVILSPHIAFNTSDAVENMLSIAINNITSYFKGTPENIV